MGFLRKVFGVQQQIDVAQQNADATIAATKQAAMDTQSTINAQAKAAADQLAAQAAREAVAQQASDNASKPLEQATVLLDDPSTARPTRKTRGAFGRGTSGVSI